MARLVWAVLCRDAVVDRDSNNIYLHRVLERVQITSTEPLPETEDNETPGLPLEGVLATLWVRDDLEKPEETTMRVRLISPNGHSHTMPEIHIDLTHYPRTRARAHFEGLPFHGSGEYNYIVEQYSYEDQDWKTVAVVPLEIRVSGDPEIPDPAS